MSAKPSSSLGNLSSYDIDMPFMNVVPVAGIVTIFLTVYNLSYLWLEDPFFFSVDFDVDIILNFFLIKFNLNIMKRQISRYRLILIISFDGPIIPPWLSLSHLKIYQNYDAFGQLALIFYQTSYSLDSFFIITASLARPVDS